MGRVKPRKSIREARAQDPGEFRREIGCGEGTSTSLGKARKEVG